MTDQDYLDRQSPKPQPESRGHRVRSAVLIETELNEARRDIAEAEIRRDQTEIDRLRYLIEKLVNELQPKILDPHMQAHGPIRRTGYHQKKAQA